ncbi:MAG TPA: DUF4340 domain-containing protein [Kofleriaceae bacterium]|jgi:hypothetical protein
MKGAIIHGVLLVVMLVYGYRTWTRDKTVRPDTGSIPMWTKSADELVSIEFKNDKKEVKIERKGTGKDAYFWGSETTITKVPKQPEDGSAGSGSAAEMEEKRKTREFPLAPAGDDTVNAWEVAKAIRALGTPTDDQKKEYKLADAKATLTVTLNDGPHTFLVGGTTYGGADRYVLEQSTNNAFLLAKLMVGNLETGETALHLVDPLGFDAVKVEQATVESAGKSKEYARIETQVEGKTVKTWADAGTKKPDAVIQNFLDSLTKLKPVDYRVDLKIADLTPVLSVSYRDGAAAALGKLALYKYEKPGELPPGTELDPANPPKSTTQYVIVTDKTRVPAGVRDDIAKSAETDVANVLSDHPVEVKSVDPKGKNPFANVPIDRPKAQGSGSAAPSLMPHPALPPTGSGSAVAPAPAH